MHKYGNTQCSTGIIFWSNKSFNYISACILVLNNMLWPYSYQVLIFLKLIAYIAYNTVSHWMCYKCFNLRDDMAYFMMLFIYIYIQNMCSIRKMLIANTYRKCINILNNGVEGNIFFKY